MVQTEREKQIAIHHRGVEIGAELFGVKRMMGGDVKQEK